MKLLFIDKRISNTKSALSKIITLAIVAVVVLAVVGGVFVYFSSARGTPSSGTNVNCSSSSPTNASAVQVSIYSGASSSANAPGYAPDSIVLVIGQNNTVTWTNHDSVHHTVTTSSAPSGASFSSGDMQSGATYTCSFTTAGTYHYYCTYHSWMVGTILVVSA